jgi:hypothetical protein
MALADRIREKWVQKLRERGDVDPHLCDALEKALEVHADDAIDRKALLTALEAALPQTR